MIRWVRRLLRLGCPLCGGRVVSRGIEAQYLPYGEGAFVVADVGVCQHCHAEWQRW